MARPPPLAPGSAPTRLAAAMVAALIVYGSLYPFDFAAVPDFSFRDMAPGTRSTDIQLSDIWANVVLFVPLGFASALALRRIRAGALGLLLLGGAALAAALQFTQLYLPSRVPSSGDVLWNLIGLVGGMAAGAMPAVRRGTLKAGSELLSGPGLLIALWIAAQLAPFVPSLDIQNLKNGFKPLLDPELPPERLAQGLIGWLIVLHLAGRLGLPAVAVFAMIGGTLATEVLVVGNGLDADDVAGAGVALAVWSLARRLSHVGPALAALVAALLVWRGLSPFDFQAIPQPVVWLPFASLIEGRPVQETEILLEKAFLYGSLAWLLRGVGRAWAAATVALVTAIELCQIWLPTRVSDVTDPILALALAALLASIARAQEALPPDG